MKKAVRLVQANLDVISTKDRVMLPTHDVLSVVRLKNGVLAEVQFAFETIAAIKSLAHGAYNYGRVDTWTNIEKGDGLLALFLKDLYNSVFLRLLHNLSENHPGRGRQRRRKNFPKSSKPHPPRTQGQHTP